MSPQAERNARKPTPAPKKEAPARPPRSRVPLLARIGGWRDQHFYSFFSSLGRLAARPWATALTVLVLGFALALPLLFLLVFQNARDLSGGMRAAREVTVFLKPGLDLAASESLAQRLRARKHAAWGRARAELEAIIAETVGTPRALSGGTGTAPGDRGATRGGGAD
jgi:cell division transport system permease protein